MLFYLFIICVNQLSFNKHKLNKCKLNKYDKYGIILKKDITLF